MITEQRLLERGYQYRETVWNTETQRWLEDLSKTSLAARTGVRVYSKRQELSGKSWEGSYGLERRALIHRALVFEGEILSLVSFHAIQNLTDGTWWICANVPPVLEM